MSNFNYLNEINNILTMDGDLNRGPAPRWQKKAMDASSSSMHNGSLNTSKLSVRSPVGRMNDYKLDCVLNLCRFLLTMVTRPWQRQCPARRRRRWEQQRRQAKRARRQRRRHRLPAAIDLFRIAETVILSWDIIW